MLALRNVYPGNMLPALFVSVNMRSLSGRWPNPFSAVSGWYVCCVLNIWWLSLPLLWYPQLQSIGGDLETQNASCVWITKSVHSVEDRLARSHVSALPHMQSTETEKCFVSGNFKDDTIWSMCCTEGNKETDKWACTVCTVSALTLGSHHCLLPGTYLLPTKTIRLDFT